MFKKLLSLGAFFMAVQLAVPAHSVNYKLLEQEADSCISKIWAGTRVPKTKIQDSLDFLYDSDNVDNRYSQTSNFMKFYEKITNQVKDQKFLQFAEDCRGLQEESSNINTKIAVHLLLEKVSEKYSKELTKTEKLKAFNEKQKSREDLGKDNLFNIFLNADKTIVIN
jgi:hypothetical protein